MSIQRYGPVWTGDESCSIAGNATGEYVLYTDHVAAMEAEAESAYDLGVIYGINHERARIRQAVEALESGFLLCVERAAVLSIIDGEES